MLFILQCFHIRFSNIDIREKWLLAFKYYHCGGRYCRNWRIGWEWDVLSWSFNLIRVTNKITLNLIKMFASLTCLCSNTRADSRLQWVEYFESPVCRSLLPPICNNNIGYSRILTFTAEMTVTGGLILFSNRNNRVAK